MTIESILYHKVKNLIQKAQDLLNQRPLGNAGHLYLDEIGHEIELLGSPAIECLVGIASSDAEKEIPVCIILNRIKTKGSALGLAKILSMTEDTYAVASSARALGSMGKDALEPIRDLVKTHSVDELSHYKWTKLIESLGVIADISCLPLIIEIEQKNPSVNLETIEALSKIGKPAVETLLDLLRDGKLMNVVIGALARIGDRRAVLPLIGLLDDKRYQDHAIYALGRLKDKRAVEPLIAQFKTIPDSASAFVWRISLIEALGSLKDERAVESIASCLKDKDKGVRLAAIAALKKIKSTKAIGALTEMLSDGQREIREKATQALTYLQKEIPIQHLAERMKDRSKHVRIATIQALEKAGSKEAIDLLCKGMSDTEDKVRNETAQILGRMKSLHSVPFLVRALTDPLSSVRKSSYEALKNIISEHGPVPVADILRTNIGDELAGCGENKPCQFLSSNKVEERMAAGSELTENILKINYLMQIIESNDGSELDRDRTDAVEALGEIDHSLAIEHLILLTASDDLEIKKAASIAVARLDFDKLTSILFRLSQSKQIDIPRFREQIKTGLYLSNLYARIDETMIGSREPDFDIVKLLAEVFALVPPDDL